MEAPNLLIAAGVTAINRFDRCRLRTFQLGGHGAAARLRRKLEQPLVRVVRVRSHQLHRQPALCAVRRARVLARSLRCRHLAQAFRFQSSAPIVQPVVSKR